MSNRRKLKDLTIRDNFMFTAVMMQDDNCKEFLEMLLEIKIERINISYEKSFLYNPEYKGIRLDVYASDEQNTRYDIEMQVAKEELGKRARYYHSQMDMDLLESGHDYEELPMTYVIFICDFDSFGMEKHCYTFENHCKQDVSLTMGDESRSIFLSTKGKDDNCISKTLKDFLDFVRNDTSTNDTATSSEYVRKLQKTISKVKQNREWEQRFMYIEDYWRIMKKQNEVEVRQKDILELLEDLGDIPESLSARVMSESDFSRLKIMLKMAAKADSLESFDEAISNL